MDKPFYAIVSAAALLLCGCDQVPGRFQIVHAGSSTFVLNRATGETHLIDGASLVPVKPVLAVAANQSTSAARSWPEVDIPQLGDLKLKVRTKYRDGQMLYDIIATPFQGRLEKEFAGIPGELMRKPTLYIDFYDEDGFQAGDPIALAVRGGGTRVVNEKGEAYALMWRGSRPMSGETYQALRSQNVRWAGFDKE